MAQAKTVPREEGLAQVGNARAWVDAARWYRKWGGWTSNVFAVTVKRRVAFQWGLRFLSLMMLAQGLLVALLLWQAAKGLRAPPGAGYT